MVSAGLLALSSQGFSFGITSPTSESVMKSGMEVTVQIDIGTEMGVHRARYFWYRQGEEPAMLQQAFLTLVVTVSMKDAMVFRYS